jgi:predicted nucleotide-binding protein (sugar kinase/HSP70/actin superfamily)
MVVNSESRGLAIQSQAACLPVTLAYTHAITLGRKTAAL